MHPAAAVLQAPRNPATAGPHPLPFPQRLSLQDPHSSRQQVSTRQRQTEPTRGGVPSAHKDRKRVSVVQSQVAHTPCSQGPHTNCSAPCSIPPPSTTPSPATGTPMCSNHGAPHCTAPSPFGANPHGCPACPRAHSGPLATPPRAAVLLHDVALHQHKCGSTQPSPAQPSRGSLTAAP